jgi:hypothetical protein
MAKRTVAKFRSGDKKSGLVRVIYPVRTESGSIRFRKQLISSDQLSNFLSSQKK